MAALLRYFFAVEKVAKCFVIFYRTIMKNNIKIPQDALNRFLSMNEFIMNLINKKGNISQIGDSDNGMAIRLSSDKDIVVLHSARLRIVFISINAIQCYCLIAQR